MTSFDFDISGILTVTATEKGEGKQGSLVVNNAAVHRMSSHELTAARAELDDLFTQGFDEQFGAGLELDETISGADQSLPSALSSELVALQNRAQEMLEILEDDEDINELEDLLEQLKIAIVNPDQAAIKQVQEEIEDFIYYVNSNAGSEGEEE